MAAPTAADGGNDGALGATRDVRLESSFADALNDVVALPPKTKAAILSRLWRNL
jgi:hypothetical protein